MGRSLPASNEHSTEGNMGAIAGPMNETKLGMTWPELMELSTAEVFNIMLATKVARRPPEMRPRLTVTFSSVAAS